jgi:geranylgeranyl pyrophosphate synthase
MQIPALALPLVAQPRPERPPQANVPATKEERDRIRRIVKAYVATHNPVPPMPMDELRVHGEAIIKLADLDPMHLDYVAVLVNNEAWRETLAQVPFSRRLLLLPKCLRDEERCPAPFDEFGLLCKQCGLCSIQDLQEEAERLGYAVLTAEGSAIVMAIIETGKIDAIVGVSCLSVLEKAFPYMEAAAIPGVAIPLLQDDCKDCNVDLDWVWDLVHLTSDDETRRLNLDAMREEVDSWFTPEAMDAVLGPAESHPEKVGREWLARSGKRWRPFLAVCAYKALQDDLQAPLPADLRKIALAVECFHKASLIHDDIEDDDDVRYDEPTLHEEHGIPIALNVGDYLIGEGYRLIAESNAPADVKAAMLKVAAEGHRQLSIGQGTELAWMRDPKPIRAQQVLELFRKKTAPAFEVALRLGALYGGADEAVHDILKAYSDALGVAYQVRDDLDDFRGSIDSNDTEAMRLSVLLALAHERAKGDDKKLLADAWLGKTPSDHVAADVRRLCNELDVVGRAHHLFDSFREQAVRSLRTLDNANLKGLLRRVIGKVFNEIEIKGWCKEHQAELEHPAGNAASGPVGAASAG